MKFLHEMDQRAYQMAKHASTKFSDLENPFTALKKLTSEAVSKTAAPRFRLTRLQPLNIKAKPLTRQTDLAAAGNNEEQKVQTENQNDS